MLRTHGTTDRPALRNLASALVIGWIFLVVMIPPARAAGESDTVDAPAPRLSLVKAMITHVSRDAAFALTVVDTSVGRYFVPSSGTVPTRDSAVSLRLENPGKLESQIVTCAGQEVVLLVSEDAPGLIVGCIRDAGPGYVAPLTVVLSAGPR